MNKKNPSTQIAPSDETLMEQYQMGDYMAFEQLYKKYTGRIYGYLLNKGLAAPQAQDILQETWARVHQTRDKYNSQYPFLPWLFTLTHNLYVDYLKKSETKLSQRTSSVSNDHPVLEQEFVSTTEAKSHFDKAFADLPQQQQQALSLRYQENWSFEEIAQELGASPQSARQWISRGLRTIKTKLNGGS
jgi:RNA polymerase sigma factor (sigma-70 family)